MLWCLAWVGLGYIRKDFMRCWVISDLPAGLLGNIIFIVGLSNVKLSRDVREFEILKVLGNAIISTDSWFLSTKYWCQISELSSQYYLKVGENGHVTR